MRSFQVVPETSGTGIEEVRQAAARLKGQACTVAARFISDGVLRLQFNREVAYFAQGVVNDVEAGIQTTDAAIKAIDSQQQSLYERSRDNLIRGLGLASGFAQMTGALMLCGKTSKLMCSALSSALAVHGVNNTYENTRNIMEDRMDVEGPFKLFYQEASLAVGSTRSNGNIGYYSADIGLSLYSVFRSIPDPKKWRLWYDFESDLTRAFNATSNTALTLEAGSTGLNIYNIEKEATKNGE